MISFGLEEDQQIIQETVRKFAAEELRPKMRAFEKAGVPDGLRTQFHELGLGLSTCPRRRRQGAAWSTAALVHEELAFGDPGAAVALSAPYNWRRALLALGDERSRSASGRFAEPRRRAAGAVATRSARRRSTASPPSPSASAAAGRSRQQGVRRQRRRRRAARGVRAARGRRAAGTASAPSSSRRGNAGLQAPATRHALLGLEAVTRARGRPRGLHGRRRQSAPRRRRASPTRVEHVFARACVINAARQVGLARAAYEFALEYTQERKAFGKPVAHFQSIAFTLADMAMDVEAARWMVWRAADRARDAAAGRSTRRGRPRTPTKRPGASPTTACSCSAAPATSRTTPSRSGCATPRRWRCSRRRPRSRSSRWPAPSWATPSAPACRRPAIQPFFT